jgi:hypothetical protein
MDFVRRFIAFSLPAIVTAVAVGLKAAAFLFLCDPDSGERDYSRNCENDEYCHLFFSALVRRNA